MLMEFSEILKTYETLALDVSCFGTPEVSNPVLLQKSFERYCERTPELLTQWRMQASRATILTDPSIGRKISTFLEDIMAEQDDNINQLVSNGSTTNQWQEQHQTSFIMLTRASELLQELAADIGITRESLLN